eukprot:4961691-Prymnesium_polylepis.1
MVLRHPADRRADAVVDLHYGSSVYESFACADVRPGVTVRPRYSRRVMDVNSCDSRPKNRSARSPGNPDRYVIITRISPCAPQAFGIGGSCSIVRLEMSD